MNGLRDRLHDALKRPDEVDLILLVFAGRWFIFGVLVGMASAVLSLRWTNHCL
jgi:hypothetical protein